MARLLGMTLAVTGSNGACWSNGSWEECCTVPRKHCWNRRHQLLGFANFGSFFFAQLLEDLFVSSWRFRTQTRPSTRLFNSERDSSDQKKGGLRPRLLYVDVFRMAGEMVEILARYHLRVSRRVFPVIRGCQTPQLESRFLPQKSLVVGAHQKHVIFRYV